MGEQRQISSPQSKAAEGKTERGKTILKNMQQNLSGQTIGLIVTAALGIATARIWILKGSSEDLTLEVVAAVLGACAAIVGVVYLFIKEKEVWGSCLVKVFLTYFIFLGLFFLVFATGEMWNQAEENSVVENTNMETESGQLQKTAKDSNFVRMEFRFQEDVVFKNLSYYTDGSSIEKDERADKIEELVMEQLENSGFPENYEDDKEKLEGSKIFAEYTSGANEYFEAYKAIMYFDINVTIKIALLENSREQRKEADNEFVTVPNSQNIIQVGKSLRDELTIRINQETDTEIRKNLMVERKECNRDILCAEWNILRIEYTLNKKLDKKIMDEMYEAYLWEKINDPDPEIDYDAILKVFS